MDISYTAEKILHTLLKNHVEEAAVTVVKSRVGQIRFSNNKIDIFKEWDAVNANFLISKAQKIVTASLSNLSEESIKRGISLAMLNLKYTHPHRFYSPLPEGPFNYKPIKNVYDPRILDLGDKALDYVWDAIEAALSEGANRVAGSLWFRHTEKILLTSKAVNVSSKSTYINIDLRAFVGKEATGHGDSCARILDDFNPISAGKDAGRSAYLSRERGAVEAGRYDCIFMHAAAANLLNSLGSSASAFNVSAGLSFLVDKLGHEISPEFLSIYDDPRIPGGFGSVEFDDEGIPTMTNGIIVEGKLQTYLHNRLTAKEFNTKSTGNAGWIYPHPWQIRVSEGDASTDELIQELRKGIIVMNATYTRFQNYREGDFSSIIRDGVFYVENGEIKYGVKGLRLSDNLGRIVSNVKLLGREAKQVYHWWLEEGIPVRTPPFLVLNTNFTSPLG